MDWTKRIIHSLLHGITKGFLSLPNIQTEFHVTMSSQAEDHMLSRLAGQACGSEAPEWNPPADLGADSLTIDLWQSWNCVQC